MAYFDLPLSSGGHTVASVGPTTIARPQALRTNAPTVYQPDAHPLPLSLRFPPTDYNELDVALDPNTATLWCHMRPNGPPSFTPSMLGELIGLRRAIQTAFDAPGQKPEMKYFVGASRIPGIYNLGGDLNYFAETIRLRDRERLRRYAIDCCDVSYHMAVAFDVPVVTIGLVQGDALGGGFEGAMSFQVLVAERSARMGLPEVLFNLFPGMGAYSLLARRVGAAQAERIIFSGKIYTAEELYDMGVVDILAEDGCGEAEVQKYVSANAGKHRMQLAMTRVARRYNPLTFDELRDITEIWVDTAMALDESDLRRMERLAGAQKRRLARA
jgi:DSF synthase